MATKRNQGNKSDQAKKQSAERAAKQAARPQKGSDNKTHGDRPVK